MHLRINLAIGRARTNGNRFTDAGHSSRLRLRSIPGFCETKQNETDGIFVKVSEWLHGHQIGSFAADNTTLATSLQCFAAASRRTHGKALEDTAGTYGIS